MSSDTISKHFSAGIVMRISTFVPSMLSSVFLVLIFVGLSAAEERVPMTNELLEELLKKEFGEEQVEGRLGAWQITLAEDDEEKEEGDDDEEIEDIGCQPRPVDPAKDEDEEEEDDEEEADDEEESSEEQADDELFQLAEEDRIPAVMLVLTDTTADRMRLMMPIRKFDPTKNREDLQLALIALHANFDRALDARYATQNGMLWSAFIPWSR